MTERDTSVEGNLARSIALVYLDEVRRRGITIVSEIYYKQDQKPELFVILNSPRSERMPRSGKPGALEYAKLLFVRASMARKFNEDVENPFHYHLLSAPDMSERVIQKLTEGADKLTFNP